MTDLTLMELTKLLTKHEDTLKRLKNALTMKKTDLELDYDLQLGSGVFRQNGIDVIAYQIQDPEERPLHVSLTVKEGVAHLDAKGLVDEAILNEHDFWDVDVIFD